ncbi:MAG: PKD domain-containing protein [Candidatus Thermoplasmatota archaeon]|nr:PKD domain-containing protein [Candidatus Thermoplasmatota archaeon]
MKKITFLLMVLLLVMGASGGYGYYVFVLEDGDGEDEDSNSGPGSPPIARINPSDPTVDVNETVLFSALDSTDSDGDTLTFKWNFEGDSEQYYGETIERNYPEGGDYSVVLQVTDSTGLTDETETTVRVVENYHAEVDGEVGEGETDQVEFPIEEGAVKVYITWDLDDSNTITGNFDPSTVNLILNDAQGDSLRNETGVQEGDGSWEVGSGELEALGDYEFVIEGENGNMQYYVTIDVSYTA